MQAEDIITYKDIEDMISRENVRLTVYALLGFAFTFIFLSWSSIFVITIFRRDFFSDY